MFVVWSFNVNDNIFSSELFLLDIFPILIFFSSVHPFLFCLNHVSEYFYVNIPNRKSKKVKMLQNHFNGKWLGDESSDIVGQWNFFCWCFSSFLWFLEGLVIQENCGKLISFIKNEIKNCVPFYEDQICKGSFICEKIVLTSTIQN